MDKYTLQRARDYEERQEKRIRPEDRPAFHLSSRVGWMNDPNGFSFYKGEYHLFYQYHPYDSHWGPMHWGHAVSTDLLRWRYLPAALAPDAPYDRDGCFSGSAVTLPDGRQMLMYTGVRKDEASDGAGFPMGVQTQCIAVGDGLNYEKYAGNPVIDEKLLPEGASRYDFRDPKIWQEPDGTYRAVMASYSALKLREAVSTPDEDTSKGLLASRQIHEEEEGGQILLFSSEDGLSWKFEKKLVVNGYRIGRMWECPDCFELGGKKVILLSAMDMLPEGFEYHNGNGPVCMVGDVDPETGRFFGTHHALDYGIDFYAAQTLLAPDGRRIMIAWMQNWDSCNLHTPDIPWYGQMTIPRELTVFGGRLYQQPVRELLACRRDRVRYEDVVIADREVELEGIRGRLLDLEIELDVGELPGTKQYLLRRFQVIFAKDDRYHTAVSYRPVESVLKIDRKFSGSRRAIIHQRRAKVAAPEGKLRLRIILDRFSAEVFANDGDQVMTMTFYTDIRADRVAFLADGVARVNVTKYRLEI